MYVTTVIRLLPVATSGYPQIRLLPITPTDICSPKIEVKTPTPPQKNAH